jgi:hypothetical protein
MVASGLVWSDPYPGWNRTVGFETCSEKRGETVGIHLGGTPHGHRHSRSARDFNFGDIGQRAAERPEGGVDFKPAADSGGV